MFTDNKYELIRLIHTLLVVIVGEEIIQNGSYNNVSYFYIHLKIFTMNKLLCSRIEVYLCLVRHPLDDFNHTMMFYTYNDCVYDVFRRSR